MLRVSFMEIYNEIIADLIEPEGQNLKVGGTDVVTVQGLSEVVVEEPEEMLQQLQAGIQNRKVRHGWRAGNLIPSQPRSI